MYTKRKGGIRAKKHPHSAHHRRHPHSAHHRRHPHSAHHRKTTKKTNKRKYKRKTRQTRKYRRMNMRGGMAAYPDAHIPDATTSFTNGLRSLGNSYNAGVAGQPSGNHYAYNTNVKAAPMPSNNITQTGGRKHKLRARGQRGGSISSFMTSILPEELVNVGRSVPSAFGHLADKFNGELSHPSSMVYPTQQPHVDDSSSRGSLINPNTMGMADIRNIYLQENNRVSGL
jgi:hypothetical protein